MTILYASPWSQPLSGDAATYPGAKLSFYETGTSTRQNTYTDSALSVAHANPVVADANGRFPAIYLNENLENYKAILTDSSDVTIKTIDPYLGSLTSPASAPFTYDTLADAITNIADYNISDVLVLKERSTGNGGGATWDVVAASGVTEDEYSIVTGDATKSFVLRPGETIDPKQFNFIQDGATITGQVEALQACVDYAGNNSIPVLFTKGIGLVDEDVYITIDYTVITGIGRHLCGVKMANSSTVVSGVFHVFDGVTNVKIEKISIDGNNDNNLTAEYNCIYGAHNQYVKILDCLIINSPKDGITFAANTTSNAWIEVKDNIIQNLGWRGVQIKKANSCFIHDNDIWKTGSHGITVEFGSTALNDYSKRVSIIGNKIDRGTSPSMIFVGEVESGFLIGIGVGSRDIIVSNNNCINNITAADDGIGLGQDGTTQHRNIVISNNIVSFAGAFGIDATNNCTVTGNVIRNSATHGLVITGDLGDDITNVAITGNVIIDANESDVAGVRGIYLASAVTGSLTKDVVITGNTVSDSRTPKRISAALLVDSTNVTYENVLIANNNFSEFLTRSIWMVGSDFTNVQIKDNAGSNQAITLDADILHWFGTTDLDSSGEALNMTLADGQYEGEEKLIFMSDATNSSTVSITTHETSSPEVATFNAVDEYGLFKWINGKWVTLHATCTFV